MDKDIMLISMRSVELGETLDGCLYKASQAGQMKRFATVKNGRTGRHPHTGR